VCILILCTATDTHIEELRKPESDDALAIRYMYNVGMLMPVDKDTATWTCPLMRMHLAESLLSTIIETPPTLPVINLSGGDCVRSSRVCMHRLSTHQSCHVQRIDMVELLKLLVPRISTTLLRQPLVQNVSTSAPHEYSYQFELCALLKWAFTKPLYDKDIRVIPEAKELDANRGRIDIVVFNHGVYAIELGANMNKAKYGCGCCALFANALVHSGTTSITCAHVATWSSSAICTPRRSTPPAMW